MSFPKIIRDRILQNKRIREAHAFQLQLQQIRRSDPLKIDEVFPSNMASGTFSRLVLLTPKELLHGRKFFVESLGCEVLFSLPKDLNNKDIVGFFGYSDFIKCAKILSDRAFFNVWFFEAGFLRSILMDRSSSEFDIARCFFVDDLGFHYAEEIPSRLELMLNDPDLEIAPHELKRARQFRAKLVETRLTKYNDQPIQKVKRTHDRKRVLVIEQAKRDWAIIKSGGGARSFQEMVDAAIRQNPGAEVVLKVHPDTLDGKRGGLKKSYFGRLQNTNQVTVIKEKINPMSLIESVDEVYVYSSMVGFEALMMGKKVHLFGKPCYGGWGQTIDYQSYRQRTRQRSLDEITFILYFLYQKNKGHDGAWCAPEQLVDDLLELRDRYARGNVND